MWLELSRRKYENCPPFPFCLLPVVPLSITLSSPLAGWHLSPLLASQFHPWPLTSTHPKCSSSFCSYDKHFSLFQGCSPSSGKSGQKIKQKSEGGLLASPCSVISEQETHMAKRSSTTEDATCWPVGSYLTTFLMCSSSWAYGRHFSFRPPQATIHLYMQLCTHICIHHTYPYAWRVEYKMCG